MFRLAREVVEGGGRAITTTTTRIFGAQIALAPAHVLAAEATRERVAAALAAHRHVLVIGPTDAGTGGPTASRWISSGACAPGARTCAS